MRRTADRLFGKRLPLVGAGRRRQPVPHRGAVRRHGRQCAGGSGGQPVAGKGRLAQSNAEQVRSVRQIIEGLGLQIATPEDARRILQLKGGDQVAF